MTKEFKNISETGQNTPQGDYINFYSTFDLGCSAALICAGFELISLDKTNPRKVQFIFRREPRIDNAVNNYWDDRLKVNARSFFDNIKMLKNRIYSE